MKDNSPSEMDMLSRYLQGLRASVAKKNIASLRKPKAEEKPEVELELGEEELAALLGATEEQEPPME